MFELQNLISKPAMTISSSLSDDLVSIMSNADQNKISPFMKLFWEEQTHRGDWVMLILVISINNVATLPKVDDFATHVLVFLIRSIINPFKFSLANFATTGATACQMFPLLWKAIGICELNLLKVIAVTCDGASANHKLLKLHFTMTHNDDMNPNVDVTYRTLNYFSSEKQYIY